MKGKIIDKNEEEKLNREEDGEMDNERMIILRIREDIEGEEELRKVEIEMSGEEMKLKEDGVIKSILKIRKVERKIERKNEGIDIVRMMKDMIKKGNNKDLGKIKKIIREKEILRESREIDGDLIEEEIIIERKDKIIDVKELRRNMILGEENMRIVMSEKEKKNKKVKRKGRIIEVKIEELRKIYRKIEVWFKEMIEYMKMEGEVNRIKRKEKVIVGIVKGKSKIENIVEIKEKVEGGLKKRIVKKMRSIKLMIEMDVEEEENIDKKIMENIKEFGVKEKEERKILMEMEKVNLEEKEEVVEIIRLIKNMEIGLKVIIVWKGGEVDEGKNRIIGIEEKIRERKINKIEWIEDMKSGRNMRKEEKVEKVKMIIDIEVMKGRNGIEKIEIVDLEIVGKKMFGIIEWKELIGERIVEMNDIENIILDKRKVIESKRIVERKVVIEEVLDKGEDS